MHKNLPRYDLPISRWLADAGARFKFDQLTMMNNKVLGDIILVVTFDNVADEPVVCIDCGQSVDNIDLNKVRDICIERLVSFGITCRSSD